IEIIEFPVRIAETALWLMDHQMNVIATERFGKYFVRLPLPATKKSSIFCDCTNVKREPFIRILKSITNAISLTIIYASPKNSFVAFRSIVLVNIRRSPLLEQVC
ncbi:MAG: hypothetical protein LBI05_02600, partial [Planctomycetaceae bacterium]|nr:hypothetical protein [Planctomycetaceae bacterium]